MSRKSIMLCLAMMLGVVGSPIAEGVEASKITSWSNSKTGNEKTVFHVKPGEKITFSVKAQGATEYHWLVNGQTQPQVKGESFKWTVPAKKGIWKILVKTTNQSRREWVKQQAVFWNKWVEGRGKEKFIRGMTDHRLYPLEAQKEWIVSAGNPDEASGILKRQKVVKSISTTKVGPPSTAGWESDKALAEGIQPRVGRGMENSCPAIAYNVMGDGKWILICGAMHGKLRGYYWAGDKWVGDSSRVKGIKDIGGGYVFLAPAIIPNLTGDGKWTLIVRNDNRINKEKVSGYYWDRTKWVSDPARVKGLDAIPGPASITVMDNLTGDGKWTLISGSKEGTFRGYRWEGAKWVSDAARVAGLGDVGRRSRPAAGFDVFGDEKWTLITGNRRSTFTGYYWDGKKWIADPSRVKGIGYGGVRKHSGQGSSVAMAQNLRGDGKWVLLTGYYYQRAGRGFFYNKVSKEKIPSIKDVSFVSASTAARVSWKYKNSWNHRVRYSTKPDMSDALWSDWQKDTDSPEIRLPRLKPQTTYYCQAYTYVPWDANAYVRSSIGSFTTPPARGYIRLKPGESIQDAIDSLEPAGGIVELLGGTHDVHKTVLIDRNNVVVYGPRQSIVRHCNKYVNCFFTPDLEDVDPNLYIENITFRGFTTASAHKGRSGAGMISASHVRNFTIEDIHDKSWGHSFTGVGGRQEHPRYSEDVFIRNNVWEHRGIFVTHTRNMQILNNTLFGGRIGTDQRISYLYVIGNRLIKTRNLALLLDAPQYALMSDNYVEAGRGAGIRATQNIYHAIVENNTVVGSHNHAILLVANPPMRKVLIRNNLLYDNMKDGIYNIQYRGRFDRKARATITNNIIYNNGRDGIRIRTDNMAMDVYNNIIVNSKGYGINRTAGKITLGHNNIWNSTRGHYNGCSAGTGDFYVAPLFADPPKADFRLKSKTGRWDPKAKKWVKDNVQSPCIDAGDPKAEFSREPAPNGGRVNVGAYGNTAEASKSIKK